MRRWFEFVEFLGFLCLAIVIGVLLAAAAALIAGGALKVWGLI